MQPTYFPWLGYFALINNVDTFIFLDNVQFDRRSWQQRNQIANKEKKIWLTVPVEKKNLFSQKIHDVIIKDLNFKTKHLKSIFYSYNKTKYFSKVFPFIEDIFNKKINTLSELNILIVKKICEAFNIKTNFINAKDLRAEGKKSVLLSSICEEIKADIYVAVPGSKEYMGEQIEFKKKQIKVEFFIFDQKVYNRDKNSFISNLSVLDFIFYNGFDNNFIK